MTAIQQLPEPVHVTLDGATVATYEMTPEHPLDDRVVVFCHGTPWSSRVWAEVAGRVGRGWRVLLWDMPGYGRSAKDPELPLDLSRQMARFAQLLEHWGVDRPRVVAHDIGGAVALGAHLLHGVDLESLFLWDVVTLDPWGSPFFRLVAEHADVFSALPAPLHVALVREYIAGACRHRLADDRVEMLSEPWLGAIGQRAFYRQIAAISPDDTRPIVARLGEVRCPVGIGWGAQDPWIPVEQATRLHDRLPASSAPVVLDDAGHLTPVEAPERVAEALEKWLTS